MPRTMPAAPRLDVAKDVHFDLSVAAMERWNPGVSAAADGANTISILDVIGDYWGEGVTAKRISAALRSIGAENDVEVLINSPGGDMFEGLAIYSLLREHKGKVTVKVLSLAASAASIIAMAADELQVARSGFLMIHDCWVLAVGNRNDMRAVADQLEPFDFAMADIYSARSGKSVDEVIELMDKESWLGGTAAIDAGFADSLLDSDVELDESGANAQRMAAHKVDVALAKAGMPRSERRKLLNEIKSGTPRAAGNGTPGATDTDTPSAVDLGPVARVETVKFNAGI